MHDANAHTNNVNVYAKLIVCEAHTHERERLAEHEFIRVQHSLLLH